MITRHVVPLDEMFSYIDELLSRVSRISVRYLTKLDYLIQGAKPGRRPHYNHGLGEITRYSIISLFRFMYATGVRQNSDRGTWPSSFDPSTMSGLQDVPAILPKEQRTLLGGDEAELARMGYKQELKWVLFHIIPKVDIWFVWNNLLDESWASYRYCFALKVSTSFYVSSSWVNGRRIRTLG